MYFSAGTSGLVHVVVVVVSLGALPAVELAFGDRFGRGATQDVLSYEETTGFQSKFSSGALTDKAGETIEDETSSGLDPDDNVDSLSSGDFGFDEPGDGNSTDTAAGEPDAIQPLNEPAGGDGLGADQAEEASAEGTREDPGDTGDSEDTGQATREIIVFVNLRPEPEPDADEIDQELAREAGPTDIPAAKAIQSVGEATDAGAKESDEPALVADALRGGDSDGLIDGETDKGRRSEVEANLAQAPNLGEPSPPGKPAQAQSETLGSSPENLPIGEKAGFAPAISSAAVNVDDVVSGEADKSAETTIARQATGEPGLRGFESELEPTDEPIPADVIPQRELDVTVPNKEYAGVSTRALRREDHRDLLEPEEPGDALARIGSNQVGIELELEDRPGPANLIVQNLIDVAEGNPDASLAASEAEKAQDGVKSGGVEDADVSPDAVPTGTQLAAFETGESFSSPNEANRDRIALTDDQSDPLAKVFATVAGGDTQLARALTDPSPFNTIGGTPDPGTSRTNEILAEAAAAGLAQAQVKLAKRYLLGLVDATNPVELVELLRNAAERGDVEAQLMLGALLADGRVIPQDLVQSHVFFNLAAAQGNKEANDILPVLERQMAPIEIVDSRRLAREYKRLLDAVALPRARGTGGEGLRDELMDAAAAGNTAKIAELLSRGADLEGNDTAGRTAVINAAWRGRTEVVDLLVELGADFNVTDFEGRTAVSWAASNGHSDIVKKLVDAGARPNIIDHAGLTPLMRAAWNGHEDVVKTLIEGGATANFTGSDGKSALDYAIEGRHRNVARMLRAFGA